jgi:tRNA-specific 2-thiouridylase
VQSARLSGVNWLGEACPEQSRREQWDGLTAKVRPLAKPVPACFDGETISFDQPEYGVSPGQAAVLYDGDRLLGGGWIEETVPAEFEPA